MSRIGNKIQQERTKLGLTPKQLAKKCGVSESFILEIESGKRIINEKLLAQLVKIFGKDLEEGILQEPVEAEATSKQPQKRIEVVPTKRVELEPIGAWEDALSNIIKKIPLVNVQMTEIKESRSFPIIDKKVEGYPPDKLMYVQVEEDDLSGYRIIKGDKLLMYLNQDLVNHTIALVEYDHKRSLKKIKKLEGNKVELSSYYQEKQSLIKNVKDVKIIARAIRLEREL